MTTSTSIHDATGIVMELNQPNNSNAIRLRVDTSVGWRGPVQFTDWSDLTIFDLPSRVTDALKWALPSRGEAEFDHVERLAERIAEVISDTHDLDVTDDNYGVAVACDLLGIDQDEVYAVRRKAKEDAA